MNFRDEKRRLIQEVVANCVEEKDFLTFANKQGVNASPKMLAKWKDRFFTAQQSTFVTEPKLINRFMVGADPEFAFLQKAYVKTYGISADAYIHAKTLGMSVAEPFGADLSGRQAEVRAHPSRFVLEVVASLCDTLRWMTAAYPANDYFWYAGAMIGADGCGGHIHIGRRRPGHMDAIKCLDKLTSIMIYEKIGIDSSGAQKRAAATLYGRSGDFRTQPHGYEYRTMPTWLSTPLTAYLTMTWAKLAVLHDIRDFKIDIKTNTGYTMLRNLLRAYADRDDDARLALGALNLFGIPRFDIADFKQNWGIPTNPAAIDPGRHYFPNTIRPVESTVRDVFEYLTKGAPLPKALPAPNWDPFKLPDNVHKLQMLQRTPGIGEVSAGLVSHGVCVSISTGYKPGAIMLQYGKNINLPIVEIKAFAQKLSSIKLIRAEFSPTQGDITVNLPKNIAVQYHADNKVVSDVRTLLSKSGLFPITTGERMGMYDPARFVAVKKRESSLGKVEGIIKGLAPVR